MTRRLILLRGGGDLASGVALRLHRAGFDVVITELDRPLAVRRSVSFCEAVYEGQISIEGVVGHLVPAERINELRTQGGIPVLVDPEADVLRTLECAAVVDARLLKVPPKSLAVRPSFLIGLGPGFSAPSNCDAVIETQRGHHLGRVIWNGSAAPDSRQPDGDPRRVLRAEMDGRFVAHAKIGDHVEAGQLVAEILTPGGDRTTKIVSALPGVVRGLLRSGTEVTRGLKLGDVDTRNDPSYCQTVSDKALAIGGGVLEAVLALLARSE
jgi:xanthine dehydrogenase accessory factor